MKILRKGRSFCLKIFSFIRMKIYINYLNFFFDNIMLAPSVSIGKFADITSTDKGSIQIHGNVSVGDFSKIIAKSGNVIIEKNVFIGNGCILVSRKDISIGEGTLIGEYVVIRDQDHISNQSSIKDSGFYSDPIIIGKNCWLGAKVSVLRGSVIGDGAVIGAHSLVRGYIPPYTLAVGCPAKVIKHLPRP